MGFHAGINSLNIIQSTVAAYVLILVVIGL